MLINEQAKGAVLCRVEGDLMKAPFRKLSWKGIIESIFGFL